MDVSVVIVNFNTVTLLLDTIDSLFEKSEGFSYEIIVVDNASSDNSKKIITKRYGEKVIFISLPKNLGFGMANNEAIKVSKGRNIFLLNPDTILINNAVKILCDYIDRNEDVGICGGNLYDSDLRPSLSHFKYRQIISLELDLLTPGLFSRLLNGKNAHFNYSRYPIEVTMISGADLMIKRSVVHKVGLFDIDFFMYFEDNELSRRVLKAGYKIINVPDSKIIHLGGKSITVKETSQRLFFNGRKVYYHKVHSDFYFLIANLIFSISAMTRIVYFFVLNRKNEYCFWQLRYKIFKEVNFKRFQNTTSECTKNSNSQSMDV
jgi:GT2 family glycosyltransferase